MGERNGKILVIDDQLGMRMLLQQMLTEAGYQAETAPDGKSGLEKANWVRPELILVDMKMPGMTGLEFVERLRSGGMSPPVVLMTAYDDSELLERARKAGVDRWLIKPFNINELLELVANLVVRAEA
ncbi:MAG: response regulator [Clostridia bacterium]|nr:response regulator [Clostridia bacterium]